MWFKGGELAFAFGITTSSGRLGSTLNSYIIPWLYDNYGLTFICFVGSIACFFSLINAIILVLVDRKVDKISPIVLTEEQKEEP